MSQLSDIEGARGVGKRGEYVPWRVLCLPHKRTGGVADTVRAEHDSVCGHSLCVASGDATQPGQRNDEARRAHACPFHRA